MSSVQTVLNAVRHLINDEAASAVSGYRWSDSELIGWVNEAQRAIVKLKPEANPVTATHAVTTVSARQRVDGSLYSKLLRVEGHVIPSATNQVTPTVYTPTGWATASSMNVSGKTFYLDYPGGDDIALGRYPVVVVHFFVTPVDAGAIDLANMAIADPDSLTFGTAAAGYFKMVRSSAQPVFYGIGVIPLNGSTLADTTLRLLWNASTPSVNFSVRVRAMVVYDVDPAFQNPFVSATRWGVTSGDSGVHAADTVDVSAGSVLVAGGGSLSLVTAGLKGSVSGNALTLANQNQYIDVGIYAGYYTSAVAAASETLVTGANAALTNFDFMYVVLPGTTETVAAIYGDAIRIIERDVLDTFIPNWIDSPNPHGVDNDLARYKNYVVDASDPLAFWLFPFPKSGLDVSVTCSGIPVTLTTVGDTLTLSDMYLDHLVDYVSSRALSKDTRGGAKERADSYYNKFLSALGAGRQIMRATGQGVARPPGAEE